MHKSELDRPVAEDYINRRCKYFSVHQIAKLVRIFLGGLITKIYCLIKNYSFIWNANLLESVEDISHTKHQHVGPIIKCPLTFGNCCSHYLMSQWSERDSRLLVASSNKHPMRRHFPLIHSRKVYPLGGTWNGRKDLSEALRIPNEAIGVVKLVH